jgi:mannitol-1-phosphate/altronate dehydrogenase
VSLTITEGGYHFDDVTGEFNSSDPSVADDLRSGAIPRTVFGIVTAGTRPLAQVAEAFDLASSGNHVKVLVTVGER